jgi:hypothetical protein
MEKMNMNYIKQSRSTVGCVAILAMMSAAAVAAQAGKNPVKVFILAGQSNMQITSIL